MSALTSAAVVGTGLIGTSVALALREQGVRVWLSDRDPSAARMAADLGAGDVLPTGVPVGGPVDLAVLAVPPAAVAATLAGAQDAGLARWYTDVASVKSLPLGQARDLGCDLSSFAGGHPLSGRERSGPAPARSDLFLGRPWVICPSQETSPEAVAAVTTLVRCCQAEPVLFSHAEHDSYVALVSHAPHVVAAAMAARLADAPSAALTLAGPGLADVTRVAGGDPGLWAQILSANAAPVAQVLAAVADDLAAAAGELAGAATAHGAPDHGSAFSDNLFAPNAHPWAVGTGEAPPPVVLKRLLDAGLAGVARIPGKRGRPSRADVVVQVVIRDQPGELARLFRVAGDAGVNIEDVGIEHSPGLPVGVAELTVRPDGAGPLAAALAAAGWPVRR